MARYASSVIVPTGSIRLDPGRAIREGWLELGWARIRYGEVVNTPLTSMTPTRFCLFCAAETGWRDADRVFKS